MVFLGWGLDGGAKPDGTLIRTQMDRQMYLTSSAKPPPMLRDDYYVQQLIYEPNGPKGKQKKVLLDIGV